MSRADESTTARLTKAEKAMRDDPAWLDNAAWVHEHRAEVLAKEAARNIGAAKGFAFRAAELRYDARGGMTEELARRRFEPGAAWLLCGVVRWVTGQGVRFHNIMVEFDDRTAFDIGTMTRANGWLFLGLGGANGGRT